jgi:NAD(P)-dependent dehydrogenase (short-subunit alcohol dehydrogenase family)
MNVAERVAVVTGGGGGIGGALATALCARGARVVITDLNGTALEDVASSIAATGADVHCVVGDSTRSEFLASLLRETRETYGPVDLFFANAGVASGAGLEDNDEIWEQAIGINVLAHLRAFRLLRDEWLERKEGYFVATASAAGLLTQLGSAPYSVTKHAAVGLAEWLAITYGPLGVKVSCVCPMGVDTAMLRGGFSAGREGALGARTVVAAGVVLSPREVAEAVMIGIQEERFLILPHPEVHEFFQRKASDHDRWIHGMQRFQERVGDPDSVPEPPRVQ